DALARIGIRSIDDGDIHVDAPETQPTVNEKAKYLPLVTRVCKEVAEKVKACLDQYGFPLVIGGDHSIAIGTISGIAAHMHAKNPSTPPRLGLLWFDAHADINTPDTSPSGNIHGMPVACLLGKGPKELTSIGYEGPKLNPVNVAQIGLRDLDELEKKALRESGIHAYTMADIDRRGMATVVEEALTHAMRDTDMLHVSFDIDSLDPRVAPGTGTTKQGGLTYREAHLALEMVAESKMLTSMELVEVNPTLDYQNQTAELAVELIMSALGKRIL
ncbi:MAG: arginase, partial [Planctomycetes bacterium]|nr:arginase [Planctomycetota bacterium]